MSTKSKAKKTGTYVVGGYWFHANEGDPIPDGAKPAEDAATEEPKVVVEERAEDAATEEPKVVVEERAEDAAPENRAEAKAPQNRAKK